MLQHYFRLHVVQVAWFKNFSILHLEILSTWILLHSSGVRRPELTAPNTCGKCKEREGVKEMNVTYTNFINKLRNSRLILLIRGNYQKLMWKKQGFTDARTEIS
jgi:hypothetical protein